MQFSTTKCIITYIKQPIPKKYIVTTLVNFLRKVWIFEAKVQKRGAGGGGGELLHKLTL